MQEDDAPYADGENIKIFVIFSDFFISARQGVSMEVTPDHEDARKLRLLWLPSYHSYQRHAYQLTMILAMTILSTHHTWTQVPDAAVKSFIGLEC